MAWREFLRHKRLIQFIEYMIGGGVYFWSGLGVFAICYSLFNWDWLIAKMLADVVGFSLSYFIQRYWAFDDPRLKRKTLQTGKRYFLISAITLIVDYGIVATLKSMGVTPYIGLFVSSLFLTVWNYLWYRFWVFDPNQKVRR